jgi:hypothetical protein
LELRDDLLQEAHLDSDHPPKMPPFDQNSTISSDKKITALYSKCAFFIFSTPQQVRKLQILPLLRKIALLKPHVTISYHQKLWVNSRDYITISLAGSGPKNVGCVSLMPQHAKTLRHLGGLRSANPISISHRRPALRRSVGRASRQCRPGFS